jgi:hypothetical protein
MVVRFLPAALGERDELVGDVDEGHPARPAAEFQFEDAAVEVQRLLDIADLERDVVDPNETGLHGLTLFNSTGAAPRLAS